MDLAFGCKRNLNTGSYICPDLMVFICQKIEIRVNVVINLVIISLGFSGFRGSSRFVC